MKPVIIGIAGGTGSGKSTFTNRRRQIQEAYNKEHHIIPQTIHKEIHDLIQGKETMEEASSLLQKGKKATKQAKKKLIAKTL